VLVPSAEPPLGRIGGRARPRRPLQEQLVHFQDKNA
jgi:hypothetical protein